MKQVADKKRSDRVFNVGDKVYLKVKRFLQHSFSATPASKLSPKYFGPFPILAKVGNIAYKLQLPDGVPTHSVFHVSLLKRAVEPEATSPRLLMVDEDIELSFMVFGGELSCILDVQSESICSGVSQVTYSYFWNFTFFTSAAP
ncbi:uncharacterized protein LOC127812824 [Diospyros lotus]|uniref:uncharacterized protein LOC127812824 n=1 Tax=Diospyros lotus TaxID=55363 RepID=UPI0022500FDD|nr:uncharacterized protein LOC127812824 [Diospyros lotus]